MPKKIERAKIVVYISGGVCQAVYTDSPMLIDNVEIFDVDNKEEDGVEDIDTVFEDKIQKENLVAIY